MYMLEQEKSEYKIKSIYCVFQMAGGIAATGHSYFLMKSGRRCDATFPHLYVSFGIYGSYFLLFGHFFFKLYMGRSEQATVNGINLKTE